MLSEPEVNPGELGSRHIAAAPALLKVVKDLERVLTLAGERVDSAKMALRRCVVWRKLLRLPEYRHGFLTVSRRSESHPQVPIRW